MADALPAERPETSRPAAPRALRGLVSGTSVRLHARDAWVAIEPAGGAA